ncbi:uncharacterized protein E0L32_003060 [Thyridium curvatum]|uniref:TATA element modulatory factor 1 TATA binding domain-containing protein n=1 Tax=Thyridium curvatum TaxID=1093900 RepID=A0A507BBY6_9PEZI|nr:uncharacterized protein E0L32_003060 [Thyridium curvatum]TPX17417.1 hypothetical protein E0L32_003060 [Thyridium curvatum]
MANQAKGSRWGSFLSSAVAGVEARLDTILAEGDESGKPQAKPSTPSNGAQAQNKPSAPSRSASTNRANDRLQERLARAVAAKNAAAGQRTEASSARTSTAPSPRQSVDAASRGSTDSTDRPKETELETTSVRGSQDGVARPSMDSVPGEKGETTEGAETATVTEPPAPENEEKVTASATRQEHEPPPKVASPPPQVLITPTIDESEPKNSDKALNDMQEARIKQLENELAEAQRQHQEEVHDYVEKLDAVQAKLQYLSRETTDAARKAVQSAPGGSAEKKLAEKDLQIAQLMEEGKKLGVTEQKHRTIMKKFRTTITEHEKEINDLKTSRTKVQAELDGAKRRLKRVDELEKTVAESDKKSAQLRKEIDSLRSENAAKDRTIADLKKQLNQAKEHANNLTAKVNEEALEKERKRVRELEEQLSDLQVEKNLAADRAKAQASDLKEKAERAAERARLIEVEMKAEVQVMESKLESMRVRAEEASSGAIGDSQAKLLRQVETLQSQYAIASENWQGIEATLLARISNLERERDEAQERESEMRKKARTANLAVKRTEAELEEARAQLPSAQDNVKSYESQIEALKKRVEEAEAALREAREDFEKQKSSWKEDKDDRDRGEWLEGLPNPPFKNNSRPDSPSLLQPSRTWSSDFLGLQPNKLRKTSTPSNDDPAERYLARRPSAQPSTRPSLQSGGFAGLPHSPGLFSPSIEALPTPSATHPLEQDDMSERETTASPQQMVQDMVSVSTVAAGPSVQLVERMSAAIRRLESEKVAAREELARISNQRDEARAEVLSLMKEADAGKAALDRVGALEAEVAEVKERYETTLELLGEKSELVEELRADVQDVKAMYRDLVESAVR